MAIHAQTSCTLSTITDVEAVYTYYYLSDSTITVDEAPKDGVNAPGAQTITVISDGESYVWQLTEPELDIEDDIIQSAVGKLYYIECVKFSNGTYDWGPLMTSSTYAAAKAAYNLSYQAIQQAQAANEATALLGGHFIYNSTWQTSNTPHSANIVQTVVDNGIDVSDDPTKWEYNTHIGANGIRLRYNETVLSEWKTNSLTFFKPNTIYPALNLTGTAITFYNPSNNNAQLIIGANGTLQSGNYSYTSGSIFSNAGTKIDLIDGTIYSPYFRILTSSIGTNQSGAYIKGDVVAQTGRFGTSNNNYWVIDNYWDANEQQTYSSIRSLGNSFMQLGTDNTWTFSTDKISSGWRLISSSTPTDNNSPFLLRYKRFNTIDTNHFYDYGMHIPNTLESSTIIPINDKFLYVRTANYTTDLTELETESNWSYKFWVDAAGNITTKGTIDAHNITIDGISIAGGSLIAGSLSSYSGSSTQPVYFPSSGDNQGKPVAVSWDVKTTLNNLNNEVPTSAAVKTFVENKGYLTSYTETDPTVPEWAKADDKPTYTASEVGALATSLKGANSGLAELDQNGKVPSSQLPSYVDDVLEYNNYASLPKPGESGKIYITTDDNKTYRWGGTDYAEISSSLALGETESTAYRGDKGAAAYTHAVTNKGSAFVNGFYKITTNSEGHVTTATAVAKSDITGLGIPGENTDTKVNVSTRGTSKAYLLSTTFQPTSTKTAREAVAETGVYLETSNNQTKLIAPTFVGDLTGTASGNLTSNSSLSWSKVTGTPTTLNGYGITDAKITNGVITLGSNTITPFTGVAVTNLTVDTDLTDNKKYLYVTKSNSSTPTKLSLADISIVQAVGATTLVDSNGTALDVNGPVYFDDGIPKTMRPETSNGLFLKDDGTWATPGGTYSLPIAKYNVLGGVKPWFSTTGASTLASGSTNVYSNSPSINGRTTTTGKYYAVEIDKNGRLFVNVPWSDTTYSAGTGLELTNTTFSVKLGYTTSGNNRKVQADPNGNLYIVQKDSDTWTPMVGATASANGSVGYVNAIPPKEGYNTKFLRADGTWETPGGTYSLPIAKYNTLGGVKPWFSTTGTSTLASGSSSSYTNSPSINGRTTTTGRYYAVEADTNGRLFVNIPWEDEKLTIEQVYDSTETTYQYKPVLAREGTTNGIRQIDTNGFKYNNKNGSTTVRGLAELVLGNNITEGTDGNKRGYVSMYSRTSYAGTLQTQAELTAQRYWTFPDRTGTVKVTAQSPGTTDTAGYEELVLGNATAQGTEGNMRSWLSMFGRGSNYVRLYVAADVDANQSIALPNKSGTVALTNSLQLSMDTSITTQLNVTFN
jgi:hypothetical protein